MRQDHLALFLMVGQEAAKLVRQLPDLPPPDRILIGPRHDLAPLMPKIAHSAVLSKEGAVWWDQVPSDVQDEVTPRKKPRAGWPSAPATSRRC